jgi:hypothetical protein
MDCGVGGRPFGHALPPGGPAAGGDREGEARGEVAGLSFVGDGQAPVAEQPGDSALAVPPVSAQPVVALDSAAGDAWRDAECAAVAAQVGSVVCLIGGEGWPWGRLWQGPGDIWL